MASSLIILLSTFRAYFSSGLSYTHKGLSEVYYYTIIIKYFTESVECILSYTATLRTGSFKL